MFPYIETSQLICSANQLTSFYMIRTLVVKELMTKYFTKFVKSLHFPFQLSKGVVVSTAQFYST